MGRIEAIKDSENTIAYQPAGGVARIRIALTDFERSTAASFIPQAKLAGVGLGGATMEAEIVDSMTGEQIAGLVEAQKGSRIPFAGLGEWDTAKQAIDDWAKRLQKRLKTSR